MGGSTRLAVTTGPPRRLVPGPAVPPGVETMAANNNLDAVDHGGRRFLAWRTAPTHFASADATIHVVGTDDGGLTWTHETTVALGRDVREPRFLSWGDRLLLYLLTLGTEPRRFEPDRIHVVERATDGRWTRPRPIGDAGCVVWRVRLLGGRPVMSVYRAGDTIFGRRPEPTRVELWTTDDGIAWRPLDPGNPVAHVGGTETEVLEAPGGGWVAVTRKEGPHGGWGADVAISEAGTPAGWRLRPTHRKLDSPLLFRHGREVLLLARRQPWLGGRFDLGLPIAAVAPVLGTRLYQAVWWLTPKRTALYRIDTDRLGVEWLADLPSRGDTAFCAVTTEGDGSFTVFNYSSPLDGWDRPWLAGQLAPTEIYACSLRITTL